jgi:eukaryotic-like serine/threonine-protein kinase
MTSSSTTTSASRPRLGQEGELLGGKFKLLSVVGAGGFGEVWRAQEEHDGRAVAECAVKIVSLAGQADDATGASGRVHQWVEEVAALRNVKCDAIPRMFGADHLRERKQAYIAMELLDGPTLSQRIKRGPIPWRRALAIASGIATALDTAHSLSPPFVHCDLKPQNVFLTTSGRVCVIDWGIAKLQGAQPAMPSVRLVDSGTSAEETGTMSMTAGELAGGSGPMPPSIRTAAGTPGYIAPEVYGGADATPAADRYALGVVLYGMITGRLPYAGTDSAHGRASASSPEERERARKSVLVATTQGDIDPVEHVMPSLPHGVAALVGKLLSLDPEARGRGSIFEAIAHASRFPYGVPDPPYAGLEAFDVTRAGLLFGRRAHVDAIVERLKTERALLLRGPSGCGKSSLAVAGVAARLDELMLGGVDGWETVVVRARDGARLEVVAGEGDGRKELGTVVVVDQLEELLALPDGERALIIRGVGALARRAGAVRIGDRTVGADDEVRVIATVRDDDEYKILRIDELRAVFDKHREYVVGIDAGAARELVEEPAKAAGGRLEDVTVVESEVRKELVEQATMLPMVEFALTEWWRSRSESGLLTTEAWRELGGVQGALSSVADRVHDESKASDRAAMKAVFQRLFRGDRRVPLADEQCDPGWRDVLTRLLAHRLVRVSEGKDGKRWYEATHEALARQWPLLQSWLSETAADDALVDELELAAKLWRKQGSPSRVELESHKLTRARQMSEQLDTRTRDYVRAAEDHAQELVRQARRRRRTKWLTWGTAGALLAIAAVVYIAMIQVEKERTAAALGNEAEARAKAERLTGIAVAAGASAQSAAETATQAEKRAKDGEEQRERELTALRKLVSEALKDRSFARLKKAQKEVSAKRDDSRSPDATPRRTVGLGDPPDIGPAIPKAITAPTVAGNVGNAAEVVASLQPEFRRCYSAGLKTDAGMQGGVRLTGRVGPRGDVLSVSASPSGSITSGVAACVASVLRGARFSAPAGGAATIVVPITFVRVKASGEAVVNPKAN